MDNNNKKQKITMAIIIIVALTIFWVIGILTKNNRPKVEPWAENNDSSSTTIASQSKKSTPGEITIYDIEDGYIQVPYNKNADKNSFNWEKNLDTTGKYYKYEDEKYKTKVGIDVSSYQKNINWKKVKQSGVDFVILRLGYRGYGLSGTILVDQSFEKNYKNAKKEGLEVGVYFFSQAINEEEIKEEANFVLKKIKGKEITYPVVFDLEKIKNDTARTDNLTAEEITNMTLQFCEIIKENGYTPSIYGNAKTFTTKMKLDLFNEYNKWYTDYQEKPLYPYEFDIWQYTETGRVDGIDGNVDIDIQFIKKKEQ